MKEINILSANIVNIYTYFIRLILFVMDTFCCWTRVREGQGRGQMEGDL